MEYLQLLKDRNGIALLKGRSKKENVRSNGSTEMTRNVTTLPPRAYTEQRTVLSSTISLDSGYKGESG